MCSRTFTKHKARITLLRPQGSPHRSQFEQINASDDLPRDCTDRHGYIRLPVLAIENSLRRTLGNFIGDRGDVAVGVPPRWGAAIARGSPKTPTSSHSFTNIK